MLGFQTRHGMQQQAPPPAPPPTQGRSPLPPGMVYLSVPFTTNMLNIWRDSPRYPPLPLLVDKQVTLTDKRRLIGASVALWEWNKKKCQWSSWKRNSQQSSEPSFNYELLSLMHRHSFFPTRRLSVFSLVCASKAIPMFSSQCLRMWLPPIHLLHLCSRFMKNS